MKVDIDAEGCLTITATTDMERYALNQWWSNYNGGNNSSSLALIYDTSRKDQDYIRDYH
jgi:hypothetical protein